MRGSASCTTREIPSFFSSEEKYGREEEDLHVAIAIEGVGELAQLIVDAVEHVVLEGGLEERARVDLCDLLHCGGARPPHPP